MVGILLATENVRIDEMIRAYPLQRSVDRWEHYIIQICVAIVMHSKMKPSNCSEARTPWAIVQRARTNFQSAGNSSGFQLAIC